MIKRKRIADKNVDSDLSVSILSVSQKQHSESQSFESASMKPLTK